MKKQALSLLLALSLMSVPALAKENSADNFVRSKTYASQFSDLPEDHTFYENVPPCTNTVCLSVRPTALTA